MVATRDKFFDPPASDQVPPAIRNLSDLSGITQVPLLRTRMLVPSCGSYSAISNSNAQSYLMVSARVNIIVVVINKFLTLPQDLLQDLPQSTLTLPNKRSDWFGGSSIIGHQF
jgi:hypothetical protein